MPRQLIVCSFLFSISALLVGCNSSSSSSDSIGSPSDQSNQQLGQENGQDSQPSTIDTQSSSRFVTFESGQVRPLAITSTGGQLLATNTPAGLLDIFSINDTGEITFSSSIPVGMEPVAVALRNDTEAWVVNHLSDSISIVDLSMAPPRVINTLYVGDEPRDIVFAGDNNRYAYITAAHRGQNGPADSPIDAELFTPGVGRADVWVFDADNTGESIGGDPTDVISLFGDTARALEVSTDGSRVYAAVMHSGNNTTSLGENRLQKPGPIQNADGDIAPDTGLIVQHDGTSWVDDTGSDSDLANTRYDDLIPFSLPDYDVFVLSATAQPTVLNRISGVGTTLFNMLVTDNDTVYVTNTEALNLQRFEGQGMVAGSVRGDFLRNRISKIDSAGNVSTQDLNNHLDRSANRATDEQRALSISQPLGMALDDETNQLFVAGFGSNKLFVYDSEDIGEGTFSSSTFEPVVLSGGGPSAVVLNPNAGKAYVLTRFNNAISVVDLSTQLETQTAAMFNPEPAHVVAGRPFLYAAENTSRFGDVSCASCHVFGDTDGLAWDLGNPDISVVDNPNSFVNDFLSPSVARFHPMKGPMTTQSLRGLDNAGPMHWRGDRTGQHGNADESLELAAFKEFNEAFVELLGSDTEISESDMTAFAQFALAITYPPNPIRALDNSLNATQQAGEAIFFNERTTGDFFTCNDCHVLNAGQNHFGTAGDSSVEGDDVSQEFKVPHFRNLYQKVGKFGNTGRFSASVGNFGEQIKGFGFMHDGNMDTLQNFFKADVFRFASDDSVNDAKIQQVVEFVMASDSNLAPIVGQQVTLNANAGQDANARLDLLLERAQITLPSRTECDLVAHAVIDNTHRGFVLEADGDFQSDKQNERLTVLELKSIAQEEPSGVTFTCVPPGSGARIGIDRDSNGVFNGDEAS